MHIYSGTTAILLDNIYRKYHKPEFIHPDPLEFPRRYTDKRDSEIAGLVSSSFATGRVFSILQACELILGKLDSPYESLMAMNRKDLAEVYRGFKYRFYTDKSLADFMWGIRNVMTDYGSLNQCYSEGLKKGAGNPVEALIFFADSISKYGSGTKTVLPDPSRGSACKRLNLFLRWMIRSDTVDPGIWEDVPRDVLVIPLDTHIMNISRILGFSERKNADMRTAVEITEALREYDSEDPVRFDFSLSRLGIHPDLNYNELYNREVIQS